jgi:hypothetical protein
MTWTKNLVIMHSELHMYVNVIIIWCVCNLQMNVMLGKYQ